MSQHTCMTRGLMPRSIWGPSCMRCWFSCVALATSSSTGLSPGDHNLDCMQTFGNQMLFVPCSGGMTRLAHVNESRLCVKECGSGYQ